MLTTKLETLKEHEISTLREWLKADGAKLFVQVLKARVAENQIQATRKFADKRPRMDVDGRVAMAQSLEYRQTLDVLQQFMKPETPLYRVKVIEE